MKPQILRKNILNKRDTLSRFEIQDKSTVIQKHIMNMTQFRSVETVFIYIDFRSEVETRSLIKRMLEMDKNVVVPVTLENNHDLLAVSINNLDTELKPGYMSIMEPTVEIRNKQTVHPGTIDMAIIPGSVFDERGGRMGYGGGYYDRFLSKKSPQALRIGLAFETQMVKHISLKDHDELMDYVVTEERVIEGNTNSRTAS